jgi:phospholipid-translocating ATPase
MTAFKDGWEDIKRHQSDRRVNNTLVRVLGGGDFVNPNVMQRKSKTFVQGMFRTYWLRKKSVRGKSGDEELAATTISTDDIPRLVGYDPSVGEGPSSPHHEPASNRPHWKKTPWENVAVGDFVKILDHESIPADILICSTSEEENVAFVETKNLDGETNLKSRNAVPALTHLRSAEDCASSHNAFRVTAERPDTNMFRLNAAVRVGDQTFPADMQMVLLRGTVLRNTKWIIGLVLYTGEDSKIVLNSGGTPSKRSKVERQMNPQV